MSTTKENNPAPALLALDWGTSSLRAYLLRGPAGILSVRQADRGIMNLPEGGFGSALISLCGDWMTRYPSLPIIASGMVGSAQGWSEVPYVETPATSLDLARGLKTIAGPAGRPITIAPGVIANGELPDVMRGEETQVLGALCMHPSLCGTDDAHLFVLPGTHSKWVITRAGRIERFLTFMTGELYAVLCRHSILGRLIQTAEQPDHAGFEKGLLVARDHSQAGLSSDLFSVRTLALTGRLPHGGLGDYLSGLLIGHELAGAANAFADAIISGRTGVNLIGEEALLARYRLALPYFDLTENRISFIHATPAGLWQLACDAGLLRLSTDRPTC